jgi:hypothetical protein
VSTSGLPEGLLPVEQSAVALEVSPDGQALQVQLLLQVLQRRTVPPRTHSQTQGEQTPQDAHMSVLRKELHARDVPQQAHAEARGEDRQETAHRARLR